MILSISEYLVAAVSPDPDQYFRAVTDAKKPCTPRPVHLPGQESVHQHQPQRRHGCCFVLGLFGGFGRLERPSMLSETKRTRRAEKLSIDNVSGADWSPCSVARRPFLPQWVFYLMEKISSGPCSDGGDQVVPSYKT